jgi:hypothetical protein
LADDAILACWGNEFTTIFFPVRHGLFRMFTQRKDLTNREAPTLEEMQGYIEHAGLGGRIRMYDPEWLSFFTVNERVAARMRVNRIFLLGDAAHIHSPAGGQGMNTGMQDAFNLGWKLARILRGKGDAEALAESYHAERHPVAEEVIETTSRLLDVGLSNSFLARVAKGFAITVLAQAPSLQKMLSGRLSEVHVQYKSSPLLDGADGFTGKGGFAPGERARDVAIRDPHTGVQVSLWEKLVGTKPVLLLFSGPHGGEEALDLIEAALAEAGVVEGAVSILAIWRGDRPPKSHDGILWFADPKGQAHERYGVKEASYYLVRPDQHVGARGPVKKTGPLEASLRRMEVAGASPA